MDAIKIKIQELFKLGETLSQIEHPDWLKKYNQAIKDMTVKVEELKALAKANNTLLGRAIYLPHADGNADAVKPGQLEPGLGEHPVQQVKDPLVVLRLSQLVDRGQDLRPARQRQGGVFAAGLDSQIDLVGHRFSSQEWVPFSVR